MPPHPNRIVRRIVVAGAGAMLAMSLAGPVLPTASARAPFLARLTAPGHHPRANRPWRISVTARTHAGKPLSGRIRYEYLFGGQVVARRTNARFTKGRYHDTITWPDRSVGIPLVFRVVVRTRLGVVRLPYAVKVRS